MRRVSNDVPSCNKMKRFIYINIKEEKNIWKFDSCIEFFRSIIVFVIVVITDGIAYWHVTDEVNT